MGKRKKGRGKREAGRREREQHWRRHMAAWRQGGWIQAEYCRKHGLAPADFSWWKSELARRDAVAERGTGSAVAAPFVPVEVVAREAESLACEVILRNGQRLRIGRECEPDWIAKLAGALEGAEGC